MVTGRAALKLRTLKMVKRSNMTAEPLVVKIMLAALVLEMVWVCGNGWMESGNVVSVGRF